MGLFTPTQNLTHFSHLKREVPKMTIGVFDFRMAGGVSGSGDHRVVSAVDRHCAAHPAHHLVVLQVVVL